MKKIIVSLLVVFIMTLSTALAANCTSELTDGCTVNDNLTLTTGTYNLPNGITITAPNIYLDCNGATITGTGTGISLNGVSNVQVRNCNIEGYTIGININYDSGNNLIEDNTLTNNQYGVYSDSYAYLTPYYRQARCHTSNSNKIVSNAINNGIYGIYFDSAQIGQDYNFCQVLVHNSLILNNEFTNLDQGIYLNNKFMAGNNNLTGNTFHGMNHTNIYLGTRMNHVWGNTFDGSEITNKYATNEFCYNGIDNTFLNGIIERPCSCYVPENGLLIDRNTTLCSNTYSASLGFAVGNVELDCNNAVLESNGAGTAITIGSSGITVRNCNIDNYTYGVYLDAGAANNIVEDNFLTNNQYSIYSHTYAYMTPYYQMQGVPQATIT